MSDARAASAAEQRGSARAAFRRGVKSPNLLVLAGGLVLALLALAALQWIFTSGLFTAVPEARFLRTPRDDWGHVSWVVGKLKQEPPAKTPVYLLGGSNVREQIESSATLENAVKERCGVPIAVFDLGSTNQHLGESLAIVDNLPPSPGIVVVGVNHSRLAYSPDEVNDQVKGRELLLDSPTLRTFVDSHGGGDKWPTTILPGILNYISGWVQKHRPVLQRLGLPSERYRAHIYFEDNIWSASRKRSTVRLWTERKGAPGDAFDSNLSYNLALLETLVGRARERGYTVVLEEVPVNREIVGTSFDRYREAYQPALRTLADDEGVAYVDFVDDVGLVNADFRDLTHLVEPGRVKWTGGLAEALCAVLPGADPGDDGGDSQ